MVTEHNSKQTVARGEPHATSPHPRRTTNLRRTNPIPKLEKPNFKRTNPVSTSETQFQTDEANPRVSNLKLQNEPKPTARNKKQAPYKKSTLLRKTTHTTKPRRSSNSKQELQNEPKRYTGQTA
jgi:hypothetical protein